MFRFVWLFFMLGCFADQIGFPPLTILKSLLLEAALHREQSIIYQQGEIFLLAFLTVMTFTVSEIFAIHKPIAAKAAKKAAKR